MEKGFSQEVDVSFPFFDEVVDCFNLNLSEDFRPMPYQKKWVRWLADLMFFYDGLIVSEDDEEVLEYCQSLLFDSQIEWERCGSMDSVLEDFVARAEEILEAHKNGGNFNKSVYGSSTKVRTSLEEEAMRIEVRGDKIHLIRLEWES